jgi:hypothetical protein
MSTAVIVIVIVVGLLVGITMSLLRTTRSGMPSKEVLERTRRRAQDLAAKEKAEPPTRDAE